MKINDYWIIISFVDLKFYKVKRGNDKTSKSKGQKVSNQQSEFTKGLT